MSFASKIPEICKGKLRFKDLNDLKDDVPHIACINRARSDQINAKVVAYRFKLRYLEQKLELNFRLKANKFLLRI